MSAKHRKARHWIATGIFDHLTSFSVLEKRINALPEEKDRGDVFEIFVEGLLATQPLHQWVKHWVVGDIPLPLRQQFNLPSDAKGIDGVYQTRLGTYVAYQVKYRQKDYLTFTEVAPFLGVTEHFTERVIFTNASELAQDAKVRKGVRLVRGDDFRALTLEDLVRLEAWLKHRPITSTYATPKLYQTAALRDIDSYLRTADRATVVMACGSGKTLVALWATQALKPKTVLVLVPSLTLLQQTLGEWTKHNTFTPGFRYLCVCSDQTVGLKNDEIELRPSDLEFRIDTDSAEVTRFLAQPTKDVKVIFSTYQSSPVVARGAKGVRFDVGIFDEAHKTTGRDGTGFTFALDERRVAIKKRVFFTATPRHYDIRHRTKDGDLRIQSMDDPTVYGPSAHTLSFARAAKDKIICPYKVIVSLIDKQMVTDFARKHGITLIKTDEVRVRWVANLLAFQQAIRKTGATKAITFHSRVKAADAFASPTTHGIGHYLSHYEVWHVNGTQRSSERTAIINAFRDSSKGILTNARCLTEGIDVPAVDLVAFLDPKGSRIDIAQATGRAMRRPQDSPTKTVGYVVVPLFAEAFTARKLQEAIESEGFEAVADVLNALQEQDDDLVDIIRELQARKGEGKPVDLRRLREKVEVIGPTVDLARLTASISVALADRIGESWDEWYGRLVLYQKREGNCLVPQGHKEGRYLLGSWVGVQRKYKRHNQLAPNRIHRLDDLGFVWDAFAAQWEEGYAHLVTYQKREGNCLVPQGHKEGRYLLGSWVAVQRKAKTQGTLSADRIQRLDALGFVWNPLAAQWEEGYAYLVTYKNRKGDCRVHVKHKEADGYPLGQWIARQRLAKKKGTLSAERIQRLDALGFVWDPLEQDWMEGYTHLVAYQKREGNCLVPQGHKEGRYLLGSWVAVQRKAKIQGTLSADRIQRLDALGFVWDVYEADWEEGYAHLVTYQKRKGNCLVPLRHREGTYTLGKWVGNRRLAKTQGTLSADRIQRLDALGFVWNPLAAQWEEGYAYLVTYKNRKGDCRVHVKHKEADGYPLGQWIARQRLAKKKGTLSAERIQRLDALGFVWDPLEQDWMEGYTHLVAYQKRKGDCLVPVAYKEHDGYPLGRWVGRQRKAKKKGEISPERIQRLDALEFVWDPLTADWEEGYTHLAAYKKREGNCLVPLLHREGTYPLGQWVGVQRRAKKTGTLSADRIQRLDALGFVWEAPLGTRKAKKNGR